MPATRKSGNTTDSQDLARRGNKGEVLFREGEASHDLFILEEGEIELLKKIGGKHRRLTLIEAGGFFGEQELFDPANRDASARAVTDFKVLQISPEIFEQMIRDQPDIAVYMLRKLSRELREKLEKRAAKSESEEAADSKKTKQEDSAKKTASQAEGASTGSSAKKKSSRSDTSAGSKHKAKDKEKDGSKPAKKSKAGKEKDDKPKASRSGLVKVKSKPKSKKTPDDAFTPLVPIEDEKPSTEAPAGKPRLELESTGVVYALVVDGESTIGRIDRSTGKSPNVDFTELDESRTISRQHARIFAKNGHYHVEERKGAHNGTFVNGKRLKSGESRKLKHLDKLQFGHVKTIYKA